MTYDQEIAALLVIDPYNDFVSEGGRVWVRLKGVAEANGCVPQMLQVLDAAPKGRAQAVETRRRRHPPSGAARCESATCGGEAP